MKQMRKQRQATSPPIILPTSSSVDSPKSEASMEAGRLFLPQEETAGRTGGAAALENQKTVAGYVSLSAP